LDILGTSNFGGFDMSMSEEVKMSLQFDLQEARDRCEDCRHNGEFSFCADCTVYGHIRDLEEQLCDFSYSDCLDMLVEMVKVASEKRDQSFSAFRNYYPDSEGDFSFDEWSERDIVYRSMNRLWYDCCDRLASFVVSNIDRIKIEE
jgi:hypothetical protein